jgi:hypothetical protein
MLSGIAFLFSTAERTFSEAGQHNGSCRLLSGGLEERDGPHGFRLDSGIRLAAAPRTRLAAGPM